MRVVLLDVAAALLQQRPYSQHSYLDPVGVEYIAAYLLKYGHDAIVFDEVGKSVEECARDIARLHPKVVGLSVTTTAFPLGRSILELLKREDPAIFTVMGGSHATAVPDIVKDPAIDCAVLGEGEETMADLVGALESGNSIGAINGISFRSGPDTIRTAPRRRIEDLDKLPFPIRSNRWLERARVVGLCYPPPSQQRNVAQMCWSRGCPNCCKFCSVSMMWGTKTTFRSPANVVSELSLLTSDRAVNLVMFTDPTFNVDRERAIALCQAISRSSVDCSWFAMCTVHGFDRELAATMREAGCRMIAFGLESLNPAILRVIKPRQDVSIIEFALSAADDAGILTRGYHMIGYPWETLNDLKESFGVLRQLPIDVIRVAFLTPFPGTALYKECGSKVLTSDLTKYDCEEPIIEVPGASRAELIDARNRMVAEYYAAPEYRARVVDKVKRFPDLKHSFEELDDYLRVHGMV